MANNKMLMPLQIERQYGESLDSDYAFDTLDELKNYATTSALSYSGQILYCKENDSLYKVNSDKTDIALLDVNSPTVSVERTENGAVVTVEDEEGITTTTIFDGKGVDDFVRSVGGKFYLGRNEFIFKGINIADLYNVEVKEQWHTEELYTQLKQDFNINTIRYCSSYDRYENPNIPYQYDGVGFEQLNKELEYSKKNDIRLILDMHIVQGGYQGYSKWGIHTQTEYGLLDNEENINRFVSMWGEIAKRYANEPYILGYGLANEIMLPIMNSSEEMNALYSEVMQKAITEIRKYDRKHIIFIQKPNSTYEWGNALGGYKASSFEFVNEFPNVVDPCENISFEVHTYFEANNRPYNTEGVFCKTLNGYSWSNSDYKEILLDYNKDNWGEFQDIEVDFSESDTGNIMYLGFRMEYFESGTNLIISSISIDEYDGDNLIKEHYRENFDNLIETTGVTLIEDGIEGNCIQLECSETGNTIKLENSRYLLRDKTHSYKIRVRAKIVGDRYSGTSAYAETLKIVVFTTDVEEGGIVPLNKSYWEKFFEDLEQKVSDNDMNLYVGELGIWSTSKESYTNWETWLNDVVGIINKQNISFTWHSLAGGGYGIFTDEDNEVINENKDIIYDILSTNVKNLLYQPSRTTFISKEEIEKDIEKINEEIEDIKESKLNIKQSTDDAGKTLVIGDDGNIKLADKSEITKTITLTQSEYDTLTDDEKMDGREYRTYDTGRIFKRGVEYGKETDISSKQDNLSQVKFTMRRNSVNEPRYCMIASSDLSQNLLMCEPYRFKGIFGSSTESVEKKSLIDLYVSFREGAIADKVMKGYTDSSEAFNYVDLIITVDEETNRSYAYVDFLTSGSMCSGEITVPVLDAEKYMTFAESFELVDSMIGVELCRMSDYCKVITEISDEVSDSTVWSSKKTSDEIDKITYSTDANECIPALMKTARYNLINTSANVPNSNYSWVLTAEHIKLSTGQYYRIIQDINGTKSDGETIKYTRTATSNDDVTWTWTDWVVDALISDTTSSATSTYSSAKIDEKIEEEIGKNTIEQQIEDALNCIDIANHALRLVIVSKDYEALVFRGKTYNCYDSIAVAIDTEYKSIMSTYQLGLAVIVMEGTYTECIRLYGKENISIVGVNKYKCKIVNEETDTENGYKYPPLWINPSTTVMNLTIQCTTSRNIREAYCIHTDDDGTGKVVIRNCILHCSQHACIGFGTRQDAPLFIEDCDMINDYSNAKSVLLYGHNACTQNTTREEVHITRCYGRTAMGQPLDLFNANWYYPTGARGSLPWLLYFNDNTFYRRNEEIPTTITASTAYTGESKDTINFISGGMMRMPSNSGNNIATLNYPYQNVIENVPPTSIEFNADYITETDTSISMYEIRNGICYVTMDVTSVVSTDAGRVVCTLPKPSSQMQFTIPPFNSQSTIRVGAILFANGNLSFFSLEAGQRYMHTFSYPVAQ